MIILNFFNTAPRPRSPPADRWQPGTTRALWHDVRSTTGPRVTTLVKRSDNIIFCHFSFDS